MPEPSKGIPDSRNTSLEQKRHCLTRRDFITKGTALVGLAVVGPTVLGACSSASSSKAATTPSKKPKEIYFDFPLNAVAVYNSLTYFAGQVCKQKGYALKLDSDNDELTQQIDNVTTWVNEGVPAIVSQPINNVAMDPIAKQAIDKGIIFITYGTDLPHQSGAIKFSAYETGVLLAKNCAAFINKQLGGKAQVLLLTNNTISVGTRRYEGIMATLPKLAPGAKIVAQQEAATETAALSATESVLTAHPGLNVALGYDDSAGGGAYHAFIDKGYSPTDPNIYVGGMDGSEDGLKRVQKGGIYRCSVAVSIKDIGDAVASLPISILEGAKPHSVNITPEVITATSPLLEEYLKQYTSS